MPTTYADLLRGAFVRTPAKVVRDRLGYYTGEGIRGGSPRVTHAELPGRTRAEKRANAKAARRVMVEYWRIRHG